MERARAYPDLVVVNGKISTDVLGRKNRLYGVQLLEESDNKTELSRKERRCESACGFFSLVMA
jgi:hypothetical protein